MFVILLMMFWVQSPMTFPSSWRRAIISTAILLVALIPTGILDVSGLLGLPTKSSAVFAQSPGATFATANKPFGRDEVKSGDSDRQTSLSPNEDQRSRTPRTSRQSKRLREGTLVPSTAGRLEMIGRRWMFISQGGTTANGKPSTSETDHSDLNQSRSRVTDDSMFADGLLSRTTSLTYTEATADLRQSSVQHLPNLLVVENLMLQRIVEAIREDSEDNRWEVTGVVTEFFDENRLTILTAKRSAQVR